MDAAKWTKGFLFVSFENCLLMTKRKKLFVTFFFVIFFLFKKSLDISIRIFFVGEPSCSLNILWSSSWTIRIGTEYHYGPHVHHRPKYWNDVVSFHNERLKLNRFLFHLLLPVGSSLMAAVADSVDNSTTIFPENQTPIPSGVTATPLLNENTDAFPELNQPDSSAAVERWPGWPGDCVFRVIVP